MSNTCFLCGEKILHGQNSKEHIIGDSFLGKLNLKTQKYKFNRATMQRDYSKLKLSAHKSCNNEIGSRFEEYIILLLENISENQNVFQKLHNAQGDATLLAVKEALTHWLAKIYVGLIYWESKYLKHEDKVYQDQLSIQLESPLLPHLQACFKNEWAFNVPSSLYYFSLSDSSSDQLDFDFCTGLPLGLIYLKFHNHLLIACIADGYLTEEWFKDSQYLETQKLVDEHSDDCFAYLYAVARVWSVRENLPISPKLTYTETGVIDSSREGLAERPLICDKLVNSRAAEIYEEHKRLKVDNTK